jgi:hypothetical protein
MAPIIYMTQTLLWIAHNDRQRAEQISKQVTRVGEANGLRYVVIENKNQTNDIKKS